MCKNFTQAQKIGNDDFKTSHSCHWVICDTNAETLQNRSFWGSGNINYILQANFYFIKIIKKLPKIILNAFYRFSDYSDDSVCLKLHAEAKKTSYSTRSLLNNRIFEVFTSTRRLFGSSKITRPNG